MPVNIKDREYRLIEIGAIEAREEQNGEKIVEGYATTYNREYSLYDDGSYEVKEQIDRGAFDDADTKDTIMQYNHEGRVFARISNGTLQLSSDEHGLKIRANLGGTEIGRQLYEEIKGGTPQRCLSGLPLRSRNEQKKKTTGRLLSTGRSPESENYMTFQPYHSRRMIRQKYPHGISARELLLKLSRSGSPLRHGSGRWNKSK